MWCRQYPQRVGVTYRTHLISLNQDMTKGAWWKSVLYYYANLRIFQWKPACDHKWFIHEQNIWNNTFWEVHLRLKVVSCITRLHLLCTWRYCTFVDVFYFGNIIMIMLLCNTWWSRINTSFIIVMNFSLSLQVCYHCKTDISSLLLYSFPLCLPCSAIVTNGQDI